jgi:glycosyltransferase involved in cell wall biosynthesis
MLQKKHITVIIPCYNAERWISFAIESVLQQEGVDTEILVINDGSTDRSGDLVETFRGKVKLVTTNNRGVSAARRLGAELASGAFIKFLDADDFLPPATLKTQFDAASRCPDSAIISRVGEFQADAQTGSLSESSYRIGGNYDDSEFVRYESLISQATHMGSWMLSRETANLPGLYPSGHSLGEEYAFCTGLITARVSIRFQNLVAYIVRVHDSRSRLSATRSESRYRDQLRLIQAAVASVLREGSQLSERGRREIAVNCWAKGRHALRLGLGEVGKAYIEYALTLDSTIIPVGSLPYRSLVQFFGPVWAERMATQLKSIFLK